MLTAATNKPAPVQTKVGTYRWTICGLVFFATTINYLDRQVISLLKPTWSRNSTGPNRIIQILSLLFNLHMPIGMISLGRVIDKIGRSSVMHSR
jgi:ACS family hexuronate transporter-like MFS transporter